MDSQQEILDSTWKNNAQILESNGTRVHFPKRNVMGHNSQDMAFVGLCGVSFHKCIWKFSFWYLKTKYVPKKNLCLRLENHISTYNDMRHLCANRIIGTCRKSFLYIEKVEANLLSTTHNTIIHCSTGGLE